MTRADASATSAMNRNVRLYPWYAAVFNAHFWMPVFFLYFLQHMPLVDVLWLEAIYYTGVVLLEAPSGYFSDRFGRRRTLLIANAAMLAAAVVFYFANAFATFAAAQLLLAAGLAFNSGTDTSLHYDSLEAAGRGEQFAAREARVARLGLLAGGVAVVAGGAVAMIDLRYAYALTAVGAAAALGIVAAMREPVVQGQPQAAAGPVQQLRTCVGLLRSGVLAWVFAYFVVMTVLNHVPYEFYQPYIVAALSEASIGRSAAPLTTGLHAAAAMVVAAWFAARSVRIRNRLGLAPALLLAALLQTALIFAMGLWVHSLVIGLLVLRSAPRALMTAPINAAIAPRVDRAQRATFLSMQSLAGRLAFAGWLVVLAALPGDVGGPQPELGNRLLASAAFAAAALIALGIGRRLVKFEIQRGDGQKGGDGGV